MSASAPPAVGSLYDVGPDLDAIVCSTRVVVVS